MKKVVLDTSLIIDHVRGKNKDLVKLLKLKQKKKVELIVPVAVVFEFYSGQSLREKSIERCLSQKFWLPTRRKSRSLSVISMG